MSDSLQQQLIRAGLVTQERAEALNKPKPKRAPNKRPNPKGAKDGTKGSANANAAPGKKGPPRERKNTGKRPAQSNHAKKAAKAAELEAQAEVELTAKRELKAKIKTLIEESSVTEFTGELTFSYVVGERIRQLFVTQEYLDKISKGELAITRLNRQTHLVTPEVAEQLIGLNPQWLVVVNDPSQEQPKITGSEDDPYADYKVPDDLHW